MKRRDSERQDHSLEVEFAALCKMYDLQGLLMGDSDLFTAAVEAFEMSYDEKAPVHVSEATFSPEQWMAKLTLSDALNVHLFLFVHRDQSKKIHCFDITLESYASRDAAHSILTEDQFVEWWRNHKTTIQTKSYRPELTATIKESYFDNLLERNGLKWGGNVDGFVVVTGGNDFSPLAIIENRFTRNESIFQYDPAKYFSDDYQTWKPLKLICRALNIPLFLCVYSKRNTEQRLIALAEIKFEEDGLLYRNNIHPYENIFRDLQLAKEWLMSSIDRYKNGGK